MRRLLGFRAAVAAAITAAAMTAPVVAQADTAGLVAAYGFEETTGTSAVDTAAGANPGTLAGATRTASGRFGRALSFDGADDRVNVADSGSLDLTTGMTLEAWVNPSTAAGSWRTVVIKEQAAGLAYALYSGEDSGRPSVHAYTSAEFDSRGPGALPLNTWSHLAATYDGGTLRLYVNGAQVASRALSGAMTISSSALRIGGNAIWGEYFKGLIDEVRAYNRALTAAEVGVDMNAPVIPPIPTDTTAPTAPGGLTASVTGFDDVQLSWAASTDNVGVTGYRVHRSSAAGFTPTDANRIATPAGTTFTDSNRPVGTYYYKVVATDAAGNIGAASNEASATVAPDTTPPVVGFNGSCDGSAVVRDAGPFSFQASDDRGSVVYAQLKIDGDNLGPALTHSPWYVDWDSRRYANGPHVLTIVARDAAGNEATSDPCTVVVANYTLSVVFTTPTGGATVHGTVPLSTRAYFDQTETLGSPVRYKVDGVVVGSDTSSPYEIQWNSLTVANGTHTITAEMFWADYSQPQASKSIQVDVDNSPQPPAAPSDVSASLVEWDDVVVTWSPPPGSAVGFTYRVHRSTTPGFTPSEANRIATTGLVRYQDDNRPTGTYYYRVVAVDAAGLLSASSNEASATIEPDTTPPTVTLPGTCTGAVIANAGPIGAYASDDRRVTYLQLKLDGENLGPAETQRNFVSVDWDTRTVPNGVHVLSAVARDAAGNETTSAPCPVTVQNKALSVAFTSPSDGATVSGTVTLSSAGLADGQPIANLNVQYKVDGVLMPFVGGAPTRTWATGAVPNGLHTLTVDLFWADYSSPLASASIQVDVQNSPPSQPSGLTAAVTGGDDVNLGWGASTDDRGVAEYRVHRGTSATFSVNDANRIATVTGTTYSDNDRPAGTYYYRVVAVDTDGNVGQDSSAVGATIGLPPSAGLVAAYGFEETSGSSATDGSGNGRIGTISGATRSASGKFGRTLSFDGVNDLVSVADADALDFSRNMTLEAWVNPTTISGAWRTVLIKERPGGLVYALYAGTDNGRPGANVFAGGIEFDAFGTSRSH